ncbi:hypothetical protein Tco_1063472 [Tanacetum coccineum]
MFLFMCLKRALFRSNSSRSTLSVNLMEPGSTEYFSIKSAVCHLRTLRRASFVPRYLSTTVGTWDLIEAKTTAEWRVVVIEVASLLIGGCVTCEDGLGDEKSMTGAINGGGSIASRDESGNPTEGKYSEVSSTEEPIINQEKDDNINSTNNINTASDGNNTNNVNVVSSTVNAAGSEVNAVDPKTSIELPNDPNMPELKDIVYSYDDEDIGAEADINNLDTHIPVSPIPTTQNSQESSSLNITCGDNIVSTSNQKDDKECD